jgi:hypothetical protein
MCSSSKAIMSIIFCTLPPPQSWFRNGTALVFLLCNSLPLERQKGRRGMDEERARGRKIHGISYQHSLSRSVHDELKASGEREWKKLKNDRRENGKTKAKASLPQSCAPSSAAFSGNKLNAIISYSFHHSFIHSFGCAARSVGLDTKPLIWRVFIQFLIKIFKQMMTKRENEKLIISSSWPSIYMLEKKFYWRHSVETVGKHLARTQKTSSSSSQHKGGKLFATKNYKWLFSFSQLQSSLFPPFFAARSREESNFSATVAAAAALFSDDDDKRMAVEVNSVIMDTCSELFATFRHEIFLRLQYFSPLHSVFILKICYEGSAALSGVCAVHHVTHPCIFSSTFIDFFHLSCFCSLWAPHNHHHGWVLPSSFPLPFFCTLEHIIFIIIISSSAEIPIGLRIKIIIIRAECLWEDEAAAAAGQSVDNEN